jgi:DNA-directed RNA polymerase I, II, and III subunit RPABC1
MLDIVLRVRNTVLEMLEDRGFSRDTLPINTNIALLNYMVEQFNMGIPALDIYIAKPRKVYVHFLDKLTEGKNIKDYGGLTKLARLIKESHRMNVEDELIIIVFGDNFDQELAKTFEASPIATNVSLFHYKKLLFNITKHKWVPKHEKLNRLEKIKLKEYLMIDDFVNLPLTSRFDPVCKYYGLKAGDIVKVTRPSMGNKSHHVYRYVVNSIDVESGDGLVADASQPTEPISYIEVADTL